VTAPDANLVTSPVTPTSSGFLASSGAPLPPDILQRGRERVRIAAFVMAATWSVVVIMNEGVARLFGAVRVGEIVWGTRQSLLTLFGFGVSLGVALLIPKLKERPELALDIGLCFEVFNALIVSLISESYPRHDPQAVSWVCVTIVLWPALAPSSPRKTFIAALACATTIPFSMWLAHATDPSYTVAEPFILIWLILPPYVCAFLAIIPATVIRGLGKQVGKARSLGSYELEERIGKGGMGEVYRARHRLLARPAAVKLISPEALESSAPDANRVIVERFRREAEAAATLRSPHTIELYDYGVAEDGTFYYVMELLDGIDFHDLVRRHGAVVPERALHLIAQACDSLGEAHQKGMVHRDVKPSNILACRMGLGVDYVKVLDFGLVKNEPRHSTEQLHLTSADVVSGTPAFIAPESIAGITSVGPPADVYALGCVAYWLVTGQYVFQAPNATMMLMQHLQATPVPPSHRAPKPIPQDFEQIILRCLSKDPVARPRDAAELLDLLKKCRSASVWSEDRAREWWNAHSLSPLPYDNAS
jgi:Serine/threonine protein kinase